MTRLLLARHGNTFEAGETPVQVGASTDLPLTGRGREQAEELANWLIGEKIALKTIYAGKLKRQWETAEIVARRLGLKVVEAPLTEIDYGVWEGLTAEELSMRWPQEYAAWNQDGKWPHAIFKSSEEQLKKGLYNWVQSLQETTLGITSNGLLRFFGRGKVKTGHICELEVRGGETQIIRWDVNPN